MKRKIAIWVPAFFVIGAVLYVLFRIASSGGNAVLPAMEIVPGEHVRGGATAQTILIEYSDFQCPACGAYFPLVKQLHAEWGDRMAFVYRHFPLPQHGNAKNAVYAAEAAGEQGKFWEMHDMLFEHQREWAERSDAEELFSAYAKTLGLDVGAFRRDMERFDIRERVERDMTSGIDARVNATPTFFVNGVKIQNPKSLEEFREILLQHNEE